MSEAREILHSISPGLPQKGTPCKQNLFNAGNISIPYKKPTTFSPYLTWKTYFISLATKRPSWVRNDRGYETTVNAHYPYYRSVDLFVYSFTYFREILFLRDTFSTRRKKFVFPSGHVMFCLFYRYWWNSYTFRWNTNRLKLGYETTWYPNEKCDDDVNLDYGISITPR